MLDDGSRKNSLTSKSYFILSTSCAPIRYNPYDETLLPRTTPHTTLFSRKVFMTKIMVRRTGSQSSFLYNVSSSLTLYIRTSVSSLDSKSSRAHSFAHASMMKSIIKNTRLPIAPCAVPVSRFVLMWLARSPSLGFPDYSITAMFYCTTKILKAFGHKLWGKPSPASWSAKS